MFHDQLSTARLHRRPLTPSVGLALLTLLITSASEQALAASSKRGLAAFDLTAEDFSTAAARTSWWYNWAALPTAGLEAPEFQQGVAFVPMVWGEGLNETWLRQYLETRPEAEYLLGFNEPNFATQANLTPEQAAALWPQLEAIADDFSLELVSPAVNYSPGEVDIPGTDDNGSPFAYLDAFFDACQECRVDAIAVHGYMANPQDFQAYVQRFYDRYQKPIWVTEWNYNGGNDTSSVEQQMDFMAATVRWMEAQDYVTHYAWFLGRGAGVPDLLTDDHRWTALGTLYQGLPAAGQRFTLPGRIEAEYANRLQGADHRTTVDDQGRPVVQLFSNDTDTQLQFDLLSSQPTIFRWTIQYASAGDAKIAVRVDDHDEEIITLADTGSTYYWQAHAQWLSLPAGAHQLSLRVLEGHPNFDWMNFE